VSARPVTKAHQEIHVEEFLHRRVRLLGGHTVKLIPAIEKGLPDRLVLLPGGAMYLVELKADDGSLDPAQVVWHRRATAMGHTVVVLTGKAEVLDWLRLVTDQHAKAIKAAQRGLAARRKAAEDLL
jgi:hypothetical protein